MQKVEAASPFVRSQKPSKSKIAGFFVGREGKRNICHTSRLRGSAKSLIAIAFSKPSMDPGQASTGDFS